MDSQTEYLPAPEETPVSPEDSSETPLSPSELRARRWLITGAVVAGLFLVSLIVLLVFLSINAYEAAMLDVGPTPGQVVVSLIRDAAIVFVAFETLVIGALLIILMLQVQALVVLLRDEIKPMLEGLNETVSTVRGTTKFVSKNVVSPVVKWSGYLAGARRVLHEVGELAKSGKQDTE
jgi:hypothetical protein